jgi:Na+(H+)/acetate symporter ActP
VGTTVETSILLALKDLKPFLPFFFLAKKAAVSAILFGVYLVVLLRMRGSCGLVERLTQVDYNIDAAMEVVLLVVCMRWGGRT